MLSCRTLSNEETEIHHLIVIAKMGISLMNNDAANCMTTRKVIFVKSIDDYLNNECFLGSL